MSAEFHQPVLLKEAIEFLNVRPGKKYIDATVGGAGHAVEIIKRGGQLLGIDCDPEAIKFAQKRLEKLNAESWVLAAGNFREIDSIARGHGFDPVAGIVYDLGMSSWQIEKSGKGFSFQRDEPLDMRIDPSLKVTAADLINALSANELTKLFQKYGQERRARRIARAVVQSRRVARIETTKQLSDMVLACYMERHGGKRGITRKIHPATKVFQALRIAVNDELNNLQSSLPRAFELLESGGRLVVISFHSLEDRIVKDFAKTKVSKGPIRPSSEEIEKNPRARSAKMRVLEKCQGISVSECQG